MLSVAGEIVGRREEVSTLESVLDHREALPYAVVLHGEAGIGKTTLWHAGAEAAGSRGYRILAAAPTATEAGLAFAAVGDLLGPLADDALPSLPPPQRRALAVALLLEDPGGQPPDPRTLGVAVLGVLRALAEETSVLLAVDDVQWLDPGSAAALEFACRRLSDERVALLLAFRDEPGEPEPRLAHALAPERLETLQVGPMSIGALHELLRQRLGRSYSRPLLRRIWETSGGNPFFALELARALEQLPRPPAAGEPLPVPTEFDALLARRLADLPPGTVEALRVAAALVRPTVGLVEAATGSDVEIALRPAIEAQLVRLDGDRLRFTHPLFSLAVASQLEPDEARELHGCLAAVVHDVGQRAYHLALAAQGPDEEVAATLEAAAEAVAARGGRAAAAELVELAAVRTPPGAPEESRRRLNAAELWDEVGDAARALRLVEPLVLELAPGPERARALMQLSFLHDDFAKGVERGEEALLQPGLEDALGAEIHVRLANQYSVLLDLVSARSHAAAALERAGVTSDPALLAQALGCQLYLDDLAGNRISDERVRRSLALEHEAGGRPFLPAGREGRRLLLAGRLDEARRLYDDRRRRAQDYGLDAFDAVTQLNLVVLECRAGRLDEAERLASEYSRFFGESQYSFRGLYATGLVAAYAGRLEEARVVFAEGAEVAARTNNEWFRIRHLDGLAFVDLSLDDAHAALERLLPLAERLEEKGFRHPSLPQVLPHAIAAAIAAGELEAAAPLVDRLETQARALDEPWPLAMAARSRGLLAAATGDFEASFEAFDRALAEHGRIQMPFEHARTLLLLGTVQRRAKRRAAARGSLQQALAIFEEIGTPVWAEKARAELARISGRRSAGGDLTPTELRVAQLVAGGRTNREVAEALFVTVHTVEWNLSKIYRKLGLHSRAELAGRFTTSKAP